MFSAPPDVDGEDVLRVECRLMTVLIPSMNTWPVDPRVAEPNLNGLPRICARNATGDKDSRPRAAPAETG